MDESCQKSFQTGTLKLFDFMGKDKVSSSSGSQKASIPATVVTGRLNIMHI